MKAVVPIVLSLLLQAAAPAQEPREPVSFEMRPVAIHTPEIDLKAERKRLEAWLAHDGNRDLVRSVPLAANLYNWTPASHGGPEAGDLIWYPRVIRPIGENWGYSLAMMPEGPEAVAVFDPKEYSRKPGEDPQFLMELVPIDVGDEYFHGGDLQEARVGVGWGGKPAVDYLLRPERSGDYADWTERLKGRRIALLVDGELLSCPMIMDRLPGRGQIAGLRGKEVADALARGLDRMAKGGVPDKDPGALLETVGADPEILLLVAHRMVEGADRDVRLRAALALRSHGNKAAWFLPALLRSLQDERDPKVLAEVVTTTAVLGDTAKRAVPLLERLVQHDDEQVSQRARTALRQVGGDR